jgi:hypothetical protein
MKQVIITAILLIFMLANADVQAQTVDSTAPHRGHRLNNHRGHHKIFRIFSFRGRHGHSRSDDEKNDSAHDHGHDNHQKKNGN